jgi:dTDP-4-dehydrorhamnose reductase
VSETSRVLITGASGLLGRPLARRFALDPSWRTIALDKAGLDITDEDAVARAMNREKPGLIINCAAFTKVDACEQERELSQRVNGAGAGNVAAAAAKIGARLIHISTDYVFDGSSALPYREDEPPAPADSLCSYGRSKLMGEQAVTGRHRSPLIVRTAWVFGEDGPCFPKTILRLAKERPELRVVNDQVGSPTYARDLADAIYRLAQLPEITGVMHVTNSDICTWYDFAREILRVAGIGTPIRPISTAEFPTPAKRPAFSVLDNRRFVQMVGAPLRSWREAVAEFLAASAG